MSYIIREFNAGKIKIFDDVVGRHMPESMGHEFFPLARDDLDELYKANLITRQQVIKTEQASVKVLQSALDEIKKQTKSEK